MTRSTVRAGVFTTRRSTVTTLDGVATSEGLMSDGTGSAAFDRAAPFEGSLLSTGLAGSEGFVSSGTTVSIGDMSGLASEGGFTAIGSDTGLSANSLSSVLLSAPSSTSSAIA